jgi:hypothetical protein
MSITVTIENNREYVKANCPELIEVVTQDYYGDAYTIEYLPFELNMANGNFGAVFRAMGLALTEDDFFFGSIPATEFRKHLNQLKPTKLTYESTQEGIMFTQGRTLEQATRYYWQLNKICNEALKRGANITWS